MVIIEKKNKIMFSNVFYSKYEHSRDRVFIFLPV